MNLGPGRLSHFQSQDPIRQPQNLGTIERKIQHSDLSQEFSRYPQNIKIIVVGGKYIAQFLKMTKKKRTPSVSSRDHLPMLC